MNTLIASGLIFAVVVIATPLVKRQAPTAYVLPDAAELVVGQIRSTFTCEGRIYGYYADQDNNCQIFHVCVPVVLADGAQQTQIFSFFCGNQTIFDQEKLVCNHAEDAIPCSEAQNFYNLNENFGRTDTPIQRS